MSGPWEHWEDQVVDGKFHLRKYLGGSERSAVYLTDHSDPVLQRAAIKLIPADPQSAEAQLARWALAAKLTHPHLVRLFQMGRCRLGETDMLYLVMELAEEDLSQILPSRPLTPDEARDMLLPALDALAYLHEKGLVHDRLKPANIMAVADQLKISSDGICPIGDSNFRLRTPGPYDPPECTAGASSPAGDVWSLGITLVEALTQSLPALPDKDRGYPLLSSKLPPQFLDIASHCLSRDPQLRWKIAFITARLQPSLHVHRELPAPLPPARPANRRYAVPIIVGALALALILGAAKLLTHRQPSQPIPPSLSELPKSQPLPENRPSTPESGKSTQKSSAEKQPPSPIGALAASATPKPAKKSSISGLVPGEAYEQVLPDIPPEVRNTIQGRIRVAVRVRVDPSGSVQEATLDSPGPSKYFANLAVQAARRWSFSPAKVDGQGVPSEWILRFEFERAGTKVFPSEVTP
jgi:TonB family protein